MRTKCPHGLLEPDACAVCRVRAVAFAVLDRHDEWVELGRVLVEDLHDSTDVLHDLTRQFEAECAECLDLGVLADEADVEHEVWLEGFPTRAQRSTR